MNKQFKQVWDFFLHLRLNYNIFILSGPYLLGVLLSTRPSIMQLVQFITIQILFSGGVTAYNSYWDKDEGPIGGLKNPPRMSRWMLYASWVLQLIAFFVSLFSGKYFVFIFSLSLVSFWMYSSPTIRLKSRPILGLVSMAFCMASFTLLGYYSNGQNDLPSLIIIFSSIGAAATLISIYPISQSYQIEEDIKRGDITFAVKYRKNGMKRIFFFLFPLGVLLISYAIKSINPLYGLLSVLTGMGSGVYLYYVIKNLKLEVTDYKMVMRVKYFGGLVFSIVMALFIYLK